MTDQKQESGKSESRSDHQNFKTALWTIGGGIATALILGAMTWFWNADHKLTLIDYKLGTLLEMPAEFKEFSKRLADHDKKLAEHDSELRNIREAKGLKE